MKCTLHREQRIQSQFLQEVLFSLSFLGEKQVFCLQMHFFLQKICVCQKKAVPLHPLYDNGRLPEWLGTGLQNRGQRFESATDLPKTPTQSRSFVL